MLRLVQIYYEIRWGWILFLSNLYWWKFCVINLAEVGSCIELFWENLNYENSK